MFLLNILPKKITKLKKNQKLKEKLIFRCYFTKYLVKTSKTNDSPSKAMIKIHF
jgi:hypothetical protein